MAPHYDDLRPAGRGDQERARLLLEGLALGRRARILEIGCGTGKLTFPVGQRTQARIDAVDPEPAMLAVARRKDRARRIAWHQAAAADLPFSDATFDLAFMSLVVHHLENPRAAYREIRRVLSSRGQLAIWTFTPAHFTQFFLNPFFPSIASIDGARFPKAETLRRDLRAAGFDAVRMRPYVERSTVRLDDLETRVRHRYITTLDLLPASEYARGLRRIREACRRHGRSAELQNRLRWRLVRAWKEPG